MVKNSKKSVTNNRKKRKRKQREKKSSEKKSQSNITKSRTQPNRAVNGENEMKKMKTITATKQRESYRFSLRIQFEHNNNGAVNNGWILI